MVGSGLAYRFGEARSATSFATAGVFGGVLHSCRPWLCRRVLSIIAGWTYTGGPKPYGYLGLGEIFVFVFFGVVATVGTTYVLLEGYRPTARGERGGPVGHCALVINNLRDIPVIPMPARALAVRIGDRARVVFQPCASLRWASLWAAFGFGRCGAGGARSRPDDPGRRRRAGATGPGCQVLEHVDPDGLGLGFAMGLALTG